MPVAPVVHYGVTLFRDMGEYGSGGYRCACGMRLPSYDYGFTYSVGSVTCVSCLVILKKTALRRLRVIRKRLKELDPD